MLFYEKTNLELNNDTMVLLMAHSGIDIWTVLYIYLIFIGAPIIIGFIGYLTWNKNKTISKLLYLIALMYLLTLFFSVMVW